MVRRHPASQPSYHAGWAPGISALPLAGAFPDRQPPAGSDRTTRASLLRAADRARRVLPTSAVLKILGISSSRFTGWVREQQGCDLDERAACPRFTPTQLTPDEVRVIHAMNPLPQPTLSASRACFPMP